MPSRSLRVHVAALFLVIALPALAQDAPAPEAPSPSHLAAAHELLEVIGGQAMMQDMMTTTMSMVMGQNPEMELFADIIETWFAEAMDWQAMAPRMAAIYAETYTEAEMKELTAFFRTPTGRKSLEKTPELMERGALLGNEMVDAHAPELERRIAERIGQMDELDLEGLGLGEEEGAGDGEGSGEGEESR